MQNDFVRALDGFSKAYWTTDSHALHLFIDDNALNAFASLELIHKNFGRFENASVAIRSIDVGDHGARSQTLLWHIRMPVEPEMKIQFLPCFFHSVTQLFGELAEILLILFFVINEFVESFQHSVSFESMVDGAAPMFGFQIGHTGIRVEDRQDLQIIILEVVEGFVLINNLLNLRIFLLLFCQIERTLIDFQGLFVFLFDEMAISLFFVFSHRFNDLFESLEIQVIFFRLIHPINLVFVNF